MAEIAPTERLSTTTFSTVAIKGPSTQLRIAGEELSHQLRNAHHTWDAGLQTAFVDGIAVSPWTPGELRWKFGQLHAGDVEVHVYSSHDTERSLLASVRDALPSVGDLGAAAGAVGMAAKWTAIAIGVAWVLGILLAIWIVVQIVRGLAPHSGAIALKAVGA